MRRIAPLVLLLVLWVPSAAAWTWPADGPVLQGFSFDHAHPYAGGQHRGIDIGAEAGARVVAPVSGLVSYAGTVPGSGRSLTIETADGLSVTLTHLGSVDVARGAAVAEGGAVGTIGESGTPEVEGPYVHLGIRTTADEQGYLDPAGLLPVLASPAPAAPAPAPPTAAAPVVTAPAPVEAPPASVPPVQAASPAPAPAPAVAAPAQAAAPTDEVAHSNEAAQPAPVPVPVAVPAAPAAAVPAAAAASEPAVGRGAEHPSEASALVVSGPPAAVGTPPSRAAAPPGPVEVAAADRAAALGRTPPAPRPLPQAHGVRAPVREPQKPHATRASSAHAPLAARVHGGTAGPTMRASLPTRTRRVRPLTRLLYALLACVGLASVAVAAARIIRTPSPTSEGARPVAVAAEPEDPRRAGMAIREWAAPYRARGRVRRAGGRVRALPPFAGQRRADGQRDGRARHAGDGVRRQERRLAA